jgi:hypothetical protein
MKRLLLVLLAFAFAFASSAAADLRPDPAPGSHGRVTVMPGTYFCGVGSGPPAYCVFVPESLLRRTLARLSGRLRGFAPASYVSPGYNDPVGGGLPPCGPAMAWRHVSGWAYWYMNLGSGGLYFIGWANRSGSCQFTLGGWHYVT